MKGSATLTISEIVNLENIELNGLCIQLKGTESIISSDPPCKNGQRPIYNGTLKTFLSKPAKSAMSDLQRYP